MGSSNIEAGWNLTVCFKCEPNNYPIQHDNLNLQQNPKGQATCSNNTFPVNQGEKVAKVYNSTHPVSNAKTASEIIQFPVTIDCQLPADIVCKLHNFTNNTCAGERGENDYVSIDPLSGYTADGDLTVFATYPGLIGGKLTWIASTSFLPT